MDHFLELRLDRAIREGDLTGVKQALDDGAPPDGDRNAGKKPIHFAVESGLVQITELLCERGADLNVASPEDQGRSPLHMAVVKGSQSVLKCLLKRNADPNLTDIAGETPLLTAIQKGEISAVGLLLKSGADVHMRDENHNSPIHIAVEKSHGEIVQMLLNEGANVHNINLSGDSVIHVAARKSSEWILEMLREKGCDLDRCYRDGSFPLHLAAESGNLEAVKWFLLQGANPFSLDANGKTATDRAAETKQQRVVEWLRDHKAINEKTQGPNKRSEIKANADRGRQAHLGSSISLDGGDSASVPIITSGSVKSTSQLWNDQEELALGNRVTIWRFSPEDDHRAVTGRSAIRGSRGEQSIKGFGTQENLAQVHGQTGGDQRDAEKKILGASREGNAEAVTRLMQKKVDLEVTDEEGRRPLHLAALGGHDRVVRELLRGGADVGAKTPEGLSCVHYAAQGGHISTVMALLESRCDIEAVTKDGSTALHLAAAQGHATAVEWLVGQAGLKVTSVNKKRQTALDLARKAGHKATAQFLVQFQISHILAAGDVGTLRQLVEEFDLDDLCARENDKGFRSVHYAACGGNVEILKILQNKMYNMRSVTSQGYSALHFAVKYSHEPAVRWLIEEVELDAALPPGRGVASVLALARRKRNANMISCLEEVTTVRALESGDLEELINLVREGVDIEDVCKRKLGIRVAQFAAKWGHLALLKNLQKIKCDLKPEADSGKTALHFAANYGKLEAVKWLVEEAGLDASHRSSGGSTALDYAEKNNYKEITAYLKQHTNGKNAAEEAERVGGGIRGGKGEGTPMDLRSSKKLKLLAIAQSGDGEGVRRLAEEGVDLKAASSMPDQRGLRALHIATIGGHARVVQELVRGGADINGRTTEGVCALHYAAAGGHTEIIGILTEAECDVNAETSDGDTALHLAVYHSNLSTVKCLMKGGVDFARGNKRGHTPLDIATAARKADIASYLVEVSVKRALESEDTGILVELLRKGADLDPLIVKQSTEGMRAVHYAAWHGSLEMLWLLKEKNAVLTATSVEGHTALHWAARGGQLDAVKWLLSHGGLDAACRSKDGATALDVALRLRKTDVVDFLKSFTRDVGPANLGGKAPQTHEIEVIIEQRIEAGATDETGGVRGAVRRKGSGSTAGREGAAATAQGLAKTDAGTRAAGVAGAAPTNPQPRQGEVAQDPGLGQGTPDLDAKLLKAASDGDLQGVRFWLSAGASVEAASSAMGEERGLRPLHLAAWAGHVGVVRELLSRDADFKARGREGYSAIHYAAKGGHIDVLRILHEKKCNMKAKTDSGQTILHVAADNGNLKAFKWIAENTDIDHNTTNNEGKTALDVAQNGRQKSIVTYLLKIPEQEAFQKGDMSKVRDLLTDGFDVNTVFQEKKKKECRPLHLAADGGHAEIVKILLQRGADKEANNYEGMTPLHLASWGGHAEVIKVLLGAGANGDARTKEGMTAVHLASMGGHVSSIEELATRCDILTSTREGKSALHLAAEYGNLGAVQWLHLQGLDVSLKDRSGQTPLQLAKDEGHKKVVEFLLRHDQQTLNRNGVELHRAVAAGNLGEVRRILDLGANLNLQSAVDGDDGRQPLHTAALLGHTDILRELLRAGADKDGRDRRGNTVVRYAAVHEDPHLLRILQMENVDVATAVNFSGETPLHIAASRGNLRVLEWLLQTGVSVKQKNAAGMTAEEVAASKRQFEAAYILSKKMKRMKKQRDSGALVIQAT
nr:serine/threonine-protein phosphatase 6 regulatory ankyrin repeat subunit B-like [Penaeus vannamei]